MCLKNNKGMSLIVAILMLVVFSFLGITLVGILSTENISSSEDFLSNKALLLAESGVEIAITDNLSAGTYLYNLDNTKVEITVSDVGDISNDPKYNDIYKVESTGYIGEIKRKIIVKYKR